MRRSVSETLLARCSEAEPASPPTRAASAVVAGAVQMQFIVCNCLGAGSVPRARQGPQALSHTTHTKNPVRNVSRKIERVFLTAYVSYGGYGKPAQGMGVKT